MHEPDSPEVSSADVPLRKPADRSGMGVEGMGRKPGTDAVQYRKPAKSGNNQTKGHGACYRPEKEGLTMTRNEAEERILIILEELHRVYFDYNPNGDYLNVTISKDYISATNAFSYGGKDHDFPIAVSVLKEEAK
jgi:hypothetical protein